MSKHGTAGLYFLPPGTIINGLKHVKPTLGKVKYNMAVHDTTIFMQDSAPYVTDGKWLLNI